MLALESANDPDLPHPYPFDVLGAQTQGMIGYFLLQALENALPGQVVASLICQTLVPSDDPAFQHPTKFVGPIYSEAEAHRLARLRGWQVRRDGSVWRRVVASPEPDGAGRDGDHPHAAQATVPSSSAPAEAGYRYAGRPTGCCGVSKPWWTRT